MPALQPEKLTVQITFRVSDALFEKLRDLANREHRTVSDYLRLRLADFAQERPMRDVTPVRCIGTKHESSCGWKGYAYELIAQACPRCDGRVADED